MSSRKYFVGKRLRRGKYGEREVKRVLEFLNPDEYHVYHNIYFIDNKGRTAQIDHLIVSRYGLFVIETKNVSGRVTGSQKDDFWRVSRKTGIWTMKNPTKQVGRHLKTIRALFGERVPVYLIVCFLNRAVLRVRLDNYTVISITDLISQIRRRNKKILTSEKVEKLLSRIDTYASWGNKLKPLHEANARAAENILEQSFFRKVSAVEE